MEAVNIGQFLATIVATAEPKGVGSRAEIELVAMVRARQGTTHPSIWVAASPTEVPPMNPIVLYRFPGLLPSFPAKVFRRPFTACPPV